MKNLASEGKRITQVAAAAVTAGDLDHIGEVPVMALNDAAIGEEVVYAVAPAVVEGPLASGSSITVGATAYLVSGEIADSGTDVLGVFWSGTPSAGQAYVRLSPTK